MNIENLFPIGERIKTGTYVFDEDSIIHFARRFDPQIFHLDAEAAKDSLFGGLCASGWHSCAAWMRCFVLHLQERTQDLVRQGEKPPQIVSWQGFEKLQWLKPVYAGSKLAFSVTLLSSEPVSPRPRYLLDRILCEGMTDDGTLMLTFEARFTEIA